MEVFLILVFLLIVFYIPCVYILLHFVCIVCIYIFVLNYYENLEGKCVFFNTK